MIGRTISHYKILEKLGEGGMGVVYKAEDTKLKRFVALKFLPPELTRDPKARGRFIQEAQAASALNHVNICVIYEIDELEDQSFIAMEYVEGKTLGRLLKERKLPLAEVLDVAIQVTEGLNAAHKRGIVHRDVKPDNIMVTSESLAKIMDFGLAKLKGSSSLTKEHSTLGTLSYMSPEQVAGREVDSRTDIWSLGVVVYEMVTGKLPFRGEYEPALIYSILNEEPELMSSLRDGVPRELERVVGKTLAKRPEERYQNMTNLLADLRALSEEESERLRVGRFGRGGAAQAEQRKKTIAVLPFRSLSDSRDDEYFSDGTTEDIITQLSKIGELRVISRTSIMRYKNTDKSIPEIGRELNVATILEGSVRRAGERVRIVAQLLDVQTDEHMWAETYDRDMKDVFAIQSDVAEKIASALRAKLSPVEKERIERKATESTEAYNYYLKGRFYWNKRRADDLRTAIEYFNQAIETDPGYAVAYAGLASAYEVLPQYAGVPPKEAMPKAEAAARKALELDPALSEAHAVLGLTKMHYEWDWAGAESELRRAIELNPSYPTAHHWYCLILADLGRVDEALAEIKRAQELDPLSLVISTVVGQGSYYCRQYDKSIDQLRKSLELDPNFAPAHLSLGSAYLGQNRIDEAIAEFEKVRTIVGRGPYGLAELGFAYARKGKKGEATQILGELLQFSSQDYSVSHDIAVVYWGLGDKDKTLEWLGKSFEERSTLLMLIKIDPLWDGLRSDPRFVALMKKMGLEK
jgi:serine/threonine protein kinase/tetratricopeptide (TPR) repeat protein